MKRARVSPLDTVPVRQQVTVNLQVIHVIPRIVPRTELCVHTSASGSVSQCLHGGHRLLFSSYG